MRPLDTSSNIEVYDESRMIRDSASMNSNNVTIFGMDIARNSAYKSLYDRSVTKKIICRKGGNIRFVNPVVH